MRPEFSAVLPPATILHSYGSAWRAWQRNAALHRSKQSWWTMAATRRTRVIWRPRHWRYAGCACRVKDWRLRGTWAHAPRPPLLTCLDDDCVPAADWRERIAAALAKSPEALVGGRTFNAVKSSLYTEASQALLDYMYRHSNHDPRRPRLPIGSNLAMSRAAFERVGGFDPSLPVAAGEDRDLCERWLASKRPLVWVKDFVVHQHRAMGLPGLVGQHVRHGRVSHHYHRACRRRFGRTPLPGWRFYAGLLIYPLRAGFRPRFRLAALLLLSQWATLGGLLRGRADDPHTAGVKARQFIP